jgi:hypothetical protein
MCINELIERPGTLKVCLMAEQPGQLTQIDSTTALWITQGDLNRPTDETPPEAAGIATQGSMPHSRPTRCLCCFPPFLEGRARLELN